MLNLDAGAVTNIDFLFSRCPIKPLASIPQGRASLLGLILLCSENRETSPCIGEKRKKALFCFLRTTVAIDKHIKTINLIETSSIVVLQPVSKMNEEEFARSEQLALDMQFAHDLQQRENAQESQQQRTTIVRGRNTSSSRSPRRREATGSEMDGSFAGSFNAHNMLYVPCEVEGRLVEMLVDSGASSSAISKEEMIRLNLQSKLNTRYAGRAVGCGSANVLGVVENVQVSIGHVEFRLFFLVLDTNNPLLILGLDQMKKFKCLIDLEENKLVFGGKGGVEVQFLPAANDNLVTNYAAIQEMRQNGQCSLM